VAKLRYSDRAMQDLERLARFLFDADPHEAAKTMSLITSAVDVLALHPRIGRPRGHVRELVISRGITGYIALYRYDEIRDGVRVLAIRHQREFGGI
jgi:plasmid stabilization system protein ParE